MHKIRIKKEKIGRKLVGVCAEELVFFIAHDRIIIFAVGTDKSSHQLKDIFALIIDHSTFFREGCIL